MEAGGNRDIIVIGSSLGGIEALSALAAQLPPDLPAAVLVAQHRSDESPGILGDLLSRRGPLPAVQAQDGMQPTPGQIFVAPPGLHMLLAERGIRLVFGPRENGARPAIDPLFRTAAVNYQSRVIGVILTGLLGDGAAGLLAVQHCGGAAVVQDPEDAAYPEMPRRALAAVPRAQPVALGELGALLSHLARQTAPPPPPVPEALRLEAQLTERAMSTDDWGSVPSRATDFTCPECNGALREIQENGLPRYRCRVGHAYSEDALIGAKDEALEDALWVALQTLQERAQMLDSMARDHRERGRERAAARFQEHARETHRHAQRLHDLIARLSG